MPKDGTSTPETLEDALAIIEELSGKLTEATKHSREWEDRAKANKDAAPLLEAANKRIAELEAAASSGKSEVEQQLARLTADLRAEKSAREAAEHAAAADKLAAIKTRIASEKGLPSKLAELLKGDDEDAIAAHADELLDAIPAPVKKPGVPGQGNQGESAQTDPYIAAIDAALPDREAAKPKE
jgi:hypothetical protein